MLTQHNHFERSHRKIADQNQAFMDLVNCKENPLTREDLEANIKRNPARWSRFSGFLRTLPSRS